MKNYLLILLSLFFISCSNKNIYINENYKIAKEKSFNIINPIQDPIDLSYIILDELNKKGFKSTLAHNVSRHKKKSVSSQGSGFFINNEGLIITNYHVIRDASVINVKMANANVFQASVIAHDKKNDIAILKPLNLMINKKWFELDLYKNNPIGSSIIVIGFPLSSVLGADVRVTQGIISSNVGIKSDNSRFQISASIQPGNSGGPIINKNNLVVGIASSRLSDKYLLKIMNTVPQNINFAVKSDKVLRLLKTNKFKTVRTSITSLEDAITATVLINASSSELNSINVNKLTNNLSLHYKYRYHWEFNNISFFSLKIVNENGVILANASFAGDSFTSSYDRVRELLSYVLNRLN